MSFIMNDETMNSYDVFDYKGLFSEYNHINDAFADDSNEIFKYDGNFDFYDASVDVGVDFKFPQTKNIGNTSKTTKYYQLTKEQLEIFNSMKMSHTNLILPLTKSAEKLIAQINRRIRNRKSAKRSRDSRKQKHLSLEMRVQELEKECDCLKDLLDYERDKQVEMEHENKLLRQQGDYVLKKLQHANGEKQEVLRNIDENKKRSSFPSILRIPYMMLIIFISFSLLKTKTDSFSIELPRLMATEGNMIPLQTEENSDLILKCEIGTFLDASYTAENLLKEHNYAISSFSKRKLPMDCIRPIFVKESNFDNKSSVTESEASSPKRFMFDNDFGYSNDFLTYHSPLKL